MGMKKTSWQPFACSFQTMRARLCFSSQHFNKLGDDRQLSIVGAIEQDEFEVRIDWLEGRMAPKASVCRFFALIPLDHIALVPSPGSAIFAQDKSFHRDLFAFCEEVTGRKDYPSDALVDGDASETAPSTSAKNSSN